MTKATVVWQHFRLRTFLFLLIVLSVTLGLYLCATTRTVEDISLWAECEPTEAHSEFFPDTSEHLPSDSSFSRTFNLTAKHDDNSVRLEDVLMAKYKPPPGRSIFFHETRSHRVPPPGLGLVVNLTARQACAIESAALRNPNSSVFVMFVSPTDHNRITTEPLLEAVRSYSNVHLRSLNLSLYAANTPVVSWLEEGKLFTSRYLTEHTSDFLRYLTLWRWGGTYLDMDVVVLRSLEELPPNYTGAESDHYLNAAIMNVTPNGFGHEVATECLHYFRRCFNGENWASNGPGVITRVMWFFCGTKKIERMVDSDRCMGFRVFGSKAFFAIPYTQWEYFVEPQHMEEALDILNESYVAHMWNKLSKQTRVKVGSNVAYAKLAEKHCPKVYAEAGEYF